jgi:hypothetical protein
MKGTGGAKKGGMKGMSAKGGMKGMASWKGGMKGMKGMKKGKKAVTSATRTFSIPSKTLLQLESYHGH